ncbi:MAG: acetate--CoA ligase family protein, partial [Burkholderiaceae bacterium]
MSAPIDPRTDALATLATCRARGDRALDEPTAKRVLAAFGVAVPAGEVADDAAGASAAGARLGFPVAIKLVSPDGVHKSDIGGVRLGVTDTDTVREAVAALAASASAHRVRSTGFLVERMAPPGIEVVIGGLLDPRFGPVVMLGLGGVFVEIFADTAFRVCPIDAADARDMIDALRSAMLLRGARGRQPVDESALIAALLAVGGEGGLMMSAGGAIAELDVNPLIVSPAGALACDARIVLAPPGASPDTASVAPAVATDAELVERFRPLFEPRVVAVVGASATSFTPANDFIRQSLALGFSGRMVPIHPKAEQVEGLPAARSLAEVEGPIDYVYVAVGAAQVAALIDAAPGKARYVQ